jgi:hypothetical protein
VSAIVHVLSLLWIGGGLLSRFYRLARISLRLLVEQAEHLGRGRFGLRGGRRLRRRRAVSGLLATVGPMTRISDPGADASMALNSSSFA